MQRCIFLADMNSFYASVHQALQPELRGLPVIVGGDPAKRHGIVLAASYEAKALGIKTGMALWEVERLCPGAVFLKAQHMHYINFSARILKIMKDFSPLVEPFSIDEAFIDLTGCQHLFGGPVAAAQKLKHRIRDEVGVLCSVGIGPNKLLAKMAAGLQKPDGLTVVEAKDVPTRLWPLPVRELFGIGPRLEKHLRYLNIHTIGELANYPVDILRRRFGVVGEVMHSCANGKDSSPVDPYSMERVKTIGHQITLPRDYSNYEEIKVVLLELSDLVSRRVRQGGYVGRTVSLTLKDNFFAYLSRSQTIQEPTDLTEDIYAVAVKLLYRHWPEYRSVRLVGISLGQLTPKRGEQPDLFGEKEKLRKLARACDRVRDRFGEKSIMRGISLTGAGVLYEQQ